MCIYRRQKLPQNCIENDRQMVHHPPPLHVCRRTQPVTNGQYLFKKNTADLYPIQSDAWNYVRKLKPKWMCYLFQSMCSCARLLEQTSIKNIIIIFSLRPNRSSRVAKKTSIIQYGYKKWGTRARVFYQTLAEGKTKKQRKKVRCTAGQSVRARYPRA